MFTLGALLVLRSPNTQAVDRLVGFILLIFSITKFLEFTSLRYTTEEAARAISFFMWFIPLILLISCFAEKRRPDIFAAVLAAAGFLIYYMIQLMSNFSDKYTIISPNRNVGPTDGLFSWIRTDSNNHPIPFFPLIFYLLLTVGVIYTIATFITTLNFWLFASAVIVSAIVGSYVVNLYHGEVVTYFWSMFSIALIAIGAFVTLLSPG